jgi:hypothetical protein
MMSRKVVTLWLVSLVSRMLSDLRFLLPFNNARKQVLKLGWLLVITLLLLKL